MSRNSDPIAALSALKTRRIRGFFRKEHTRKRENLEDHVRELRQQFIGKSELEFCHACTIVHLRRGIDLDHNSSLFCRMWEQEGDYLVKALNLRWLVSACDTIVDHFDDPYERAVAAAGTLFINTVKLYETERRALGHRSDGGTLRDAAMAGDKVSPLFDGLTTFKIGRGDMIRNLHDRIGLLCDRPGIAPLILRELLSRSNDHDTVFKRLAAVHERPSTAWQMK